MADILNQICAKKRDHIAACKARVTIDDLRDAANRAPPPRGFSTALTQASHDGYGLIAEIKRASPSKGLIRDDFDPPALARAYAAAGATCLSVLTDIPYFQGSDDDLIAARAAVELPVLRKDFMLEPYQIVEARALGTDCVLLIMAALSDEKAAELEGLAIRLGMDVLIEIHDEDELGRALELRSKLIGINNRNLKTLETDIATTPRLAAMVSADYTLVCESGLRDDGDLAAMAACGARCFLIGESLMRQEDVEAATRVLLADPALPVPVAAAQVLKG